MRTALFINTDEASDETALLVSSRELRILRRAVNEMATLVLTDEEQRIVRSITRRLDGAAREVFDAAEDKDACEVWGLRISPKAYEPAPPRSPPPSPPAPAPHGVSRAQPFWTFFKSIWEGA